MNGMCEKVWCRLCLNNCNDYHSLYDETGHCNEELFEVAIKYFHPTILTTVAESPRTVMCLECWRHISEFHNFKKNILLVQAKLVAHIKADLSNGDEKLRANADLELMNIIRGTLISSNDEKLLPKPDDTSNVISSSQNGVKDDTEKSLIKDGDPEKLSLRLDTIALRELSTDNKISTRTRAAKRRANQTASSAAKVEEKINKEKSTVNTKQTPAVPKNENTRKISIISNDKYIAIWRPLLDCPLCNKKCNNYGSLGDHFKETHPKKKVYAQCCQRKFFSRYLLAEHARTHLDLKRFKCEVCDACYKNKKSLRYHMFRRHPNLNVVLKYKPKPDKNLDAIVAQWKPDLKCDLCHKSHSNLIQLYEHFSRLHPNEVFHIMCCQQKLEQRIQIKEHALGHIDPNAFKCHLCNKYFKSTKQLYNHRYGTHSVTADSMTVQHQHDYKCNICQKVFRHLSKLNIHAASHKGSARFKCPYCFQAFKTQIGLSSHIKNTHPVDALVPTSELTR